MFINIFYHQNIAYINLHFCATYLDNRWFIKEVIERKARIFKINISVFDGPTANTRMLHVMVCVIQFNLSIQTPLYAHILGHTGENQYQQWILI